jgi:hypothetical protein
MGEIEPVERLQRAINSLINQRLDNVNLILNSGWKVDLTVGVDLTSLVSRPGMIVKTKRMDALERIDIPDVTGSSFANTYTFLQSSLIDALGVQDYTVGNRETTPTGQKTATGLRLTQEEGNARFKLKIQIFEEEVIKKLAEQWLKLRQQFTTKPQIIRITGKDALEFLRNEMDYSKSTVNMGDHMSPKLQGMTGEFSHFVVEPDDIAGEYDFVATAGSDKLSDPIADRMAFVELLDTLIKLNPVLMQSGMGISWDKIVTELFDRYQIKGGAERFVSTGGLNGLIGSGPGGAGQGAVNQVGGGGGQTQGFPPVQNSPQVPNNPNGAGVPGSVGSMGIR